MRKHSKIRLIFIPFGVILWIFGWCLSSLETIDKRQKKHRGQRSPVRLTGMLVGSQTFSKQCTEQVPRSAENLHP